MKFKLPALSSLIWPGALFATFSLLIAGCEPVGFSEGDDSQTPISMEELNEIEPQPEAPPFRTETETESDDPNKIPAAPVAAPTPALPPVVSSSEFLWQPRADSVRIVIPATLPHWQMHVFSRRRHYTLYGPDNRGGNQSVDVEYILPGGGASWQQKSLQVGDDGTLMVFINTRDVPPGGELRNIGWRIMDPTRAQSGDGDRLMPGENR